MEVKKYPQYWWKHIIILPFIYFVAPFLFMLDIVAEIYHRVAFPLYNYPLIEREKYIKIDRYKLKYLNIIDKLNCSYCGYANGLLNYIAQIAGQTEKYWCGIKHKDPTAFQQPEHHKNFLDYNNEVQFNDFIACEIGQKNKNFKEV